MIRMSVADTVKAVLRDVVLFAEYASGLKLRSYQVDVARRIFDSIQHRYGDTIVVMFPRQSGKNELQAQIETYLLMLLSQTQAEIVKVSPTWKPQSLNAMRRLERVLSANVMTGKVWKRESGYIYRIGKARIYFYSGQPEAHIVGATASTLLEVDEAQDVNSAKYVKDILPMASSTNATTVLWGTAWTGKTLLATERKAALEAEKRDGRRRVFVIDADAVSEEVPAYRKFVATQVAKYGRNHPLIRSQYFCEEIDAEGGLFPPARRALLVGIHSSQVVPLLGHAYAVLIDIAGADESAPEVGEDLEKAASRRDLTALTAVEIDHSTVGDPLIQGRTYRTVFRKVWRDVRHSLLLPQLRAIIDHWQAAHVVVDATGMGEGIASFLVSAYGSRVIPFVFSTKSKSDLGWSLVALIETGRLKEFTPGDELQREFFLQLENCQYSTCSGNSISWGVPNGTRDSLTGELVHDDLVMSLAMVTQLEGVESFISSPTLQVRTRDPLDQFDSESTY